MVIILVHWWIKKGREAEFKAFWRQTAVVRDRRGLVGEFLSNPLTENGYNWIAWKVPDLDQCSPYINVAIWKDAETFHEQIGRYFPEKDEKMDFEFELRQRLALMPEEWRMGDFSLPERDTGGVL